MIAFAIVIAVAVVFYAVGEVRGQHFRADEKDAIFNQGVLHGIRMERRQHQIEADADINAADWWKGDDR